jgi:phosphomevalonate kinase
LAKLLGREPDLKEAIEIHRTWQGGKGSGLDVASCWSGGVIRFQNATAEAALWPSELSWQLVWSGASAATTDHITRFDDWRESGDVEPLNQLSKLSQQLCTAPNLSRLAAYQQALMDLDNSADLKIFSSEHQELVKIAGSIGLVYKPCGAGGGDIGIAFADHTQRPSILEDFRAAATAAGFYCPTLEMAQHGVRFAQ